MPLISNITENYYIRQKFDTKSFTDITNPLMGIVSKRLAINPKNGKGIIFEISLSYLFVSENRYLQVIKGMRP